MTRDEAIARVNDVYEKPHQGEWNEKAVRSSAASGTIDVLVALGVLKLDEPKSVEDQADTLLSAHFVHGKDAIGLLHRNGFKIVKA